jgi:DNA-binding MarR family transcriptional regulator
MAKGTGTGVRAAVSGPTDAGPVDPIEAVEVASRLRLSVARLHRVLRQHAEAGLSPSQLSALAAIDRHGSMTLGELATHEGVAPPTVTGIVARLEADGNVAREPDPDDRRIVRVVATPQGREILGTARRRKDAWLSRRLADLPPDELARLADALEVLDDLTTAVEP